MLVINTKRKRTILIVALVVLLVTVGAYYVTRGGEYEERIAKQRAEELELSYISLASDQIPNFEVAGFIDRIGAERALFWPLQLIDNELTVAVSNPEREKTQEVINRLREYYAVTIVMTTRSAIKRAWNSYDDLLASLTSPPGAKSLELPPEVLKRLIPPPGAVPIEIPPEDSESF